MIIFGTQDLGPLKYLLALEYKFEDVGWVISTISKPYLEHKKKLLKIQKNSTSLVVTGTSLGDSLDKSLINNAKSLNIPSVSIIEHWSWYKKRFELNGKSVFPDHVIVNDDYARERAIDDGIPKHKIFVGGNPYLEKLSKKKLDDVNISNWKRENNIFNKNIILFITEALQDSFLLGTDDYLGYDEFSVLEDIIEIIPDSLGLIIKLHPEEETKKYEHLQSNKVKVIRKMSIHHMAKIPNIIIGMDSMLLLELAMFRDDIISYRPNARKESIGQKIGATHNAGTKMQLEKYLEHPPISSTIPFRKKFKGSTKRISEFLYSLI